MAISPTVTLITPWADPPHTVRATSVSQMYDILIAASSSSLQLTYNVGIAPTIAPVTVLLRNKTFSTNLDMSLILPSYLQSSVASTFLLNANTTIQMQWSFVEADAKAKSMLSTQPYVQPLLIEVNPTNVTGPVYALTNLLPLSI